MAFTGDKMGKFPSILLVVVLTACDIARVGEDSVQALTGCNITLDKPCSDSITVADDRCSSRALQWNPTDLTLREVCYTDYDFTQVFISSYTPELLKDTLYWLENNNKGDTLVDGYAVYEYHNTGALRRQTQWDLFYSSWSALPDTILMLQVSYDAEGRPREYSEIFDSTEVVTVLFDSFGQETQTINYFLEGGQPKGDVLYHNTYYVKDTLLHSTSYYEGAVKKDSVVFDEFSRAILNIKFHPNGNLKSLLESTYEAWPNPGLLGKYESIYDEQGNLTQNRRYNAEGRFFQVKNTGEVSWSNCTEPLQFFQCYLST